MLFISIEKMELYHNSIELSLSDWRMINLPIAFDISKYNFLNYCEKIYKNKHK